MAECNLYSYKEELNFNSLQRGRKLLSLVCVAMSTCLWVHILLWKPVYGPYPCCYLAVEVPGHGAIHSNRLHEVSEPFLVLYCTNTAMDMIKKGCTNC